MNDHPESDGAASGVARRSDGARPDRSATPGYSAAPGRSRDAILALDQGTTSSRAVVFDRDGQVLGSASRELTQHYPRPGWVEHDPREIWRTQMEAAREALARAGLDGSALTAVGIANQRETALLWDAETGAPVGNAVVWQCRRTAERCAALRSEGREEWVRQITGLPLDPYFSATKFEWLLAAHPEARQLLR